MSIWTSPISAAFSGAAAAALVVLGTTSSTDRADEPIAAVGLEERRLDALERQLEAIRAELGRARSSEPIERSTAIPTDDLIDRRATKIVREMVEEGVVAAGNAWREVSEVATPWPGGHGSASETASAIVNAGVESELADELWAEAHAQGRLPELLAAVTARLDALPDSADKHTEKALAFHKAAAVHPSNQEGNWWVDSDNAFARALELDPEHWDARYRRAVNLSFWPTAYGGQAAAIEHFETLVDQQSRTPREARFADTYYWLGNLYAQQGRIEEAQNTWRRGLREHPDNGRLAQKVRPR